MSKRKAYVSMPRHNGERFAKLMVGQFEQMNSTLDNVGNSRYSELFGTPERAARTLARMCQGVNTCGTCPLFGAGLNHCKNDYTDFASIAEWLRGVRDD